MKVLFNFWFSIFIFTSFGLHAMNEPSAHREPGIQAEQLNQPDVSTNEDGLDKFWPPRVDTYMRELARREARKIEEAERLKNVAPNTQPEAEKNSNKKNSFAICPPYIEVCPPKDYLVEGKDIKPSTESNSASSDEFFPPDIEAYRKELAGRVRRKIIKNEKMPNDPKLIEDMRRLDSFEFYRGPADRDATTRLLDSLEVPAEEDQDQKELKQHSSSNNLRLSDFLLSPPFGELGIGFPWCNVDRKDPIVESVIQSKEKELQQETWQEQAPETSHTTSQRVFGHFHEGFNNEEMVKKPIEVQNAHRNAFIRGAVAVGVNLLMCPNNSLLGVVGTVSNQANLLKEPLKEIEERHRRAHHEARFLSTIDLLERDRYHYSKIFEDYYHHDDKMYEETINDSKRVLKEYHNSSNMLEKMICQPTISEPLYKEYIGISCADLWRGGKEAAAAVGTFDEEKRNIILHIADDIIDGLDTVGLTEENINKVIGFVHEAVKRAPEYIQRGYQELLGAKEAKGATTQHAYNAAIGTSAAPFESAQYEPLAMAAGQSQGDVRTARQLTSWLQVDPDGAHAQIPAKREIDKHNSLDGHQSAYQSSSSPEDISKKIAEVLNESIEEVDKKLEKLTDYIVKRDQNEAALRTEQYESLQEEQQFFQTKQNIGATFTSIAAIASIFGQNKTAYRVGTVGQAIVQVFSAARAFSMLGPAAGIVPYAGVLCAIAGIASLCKKQKKDKTPQIILDAINNCVRHLSEQMYRIHKYLIERDAYSDKKLDRHLLIVLEKFCALHLDNTNFEQKLQELCEYIEGNHEAIQNGIEALARQATNNLKLTLDNLNGLRLEAIDDLIKRCELMLKRPVSPEEFGRCLDKLYTKATERASADALTGGSVDVTAPENLQMLLASRASAQENVYAHPVFSNINLISRYLEHTFKDLKHEKLVNPLIWIKCVEAILYMLEKQDDYPNTEQTKSTVIEMLVKLKEEGAKIVAFMSLCGKNKYLKKIVTDFKNRLEELAKAIGQEQKEFEQKCTDRLKKKLRSAYEHQRAQANSILSTYDTPKCNQYIKDSLNHTKYKPHGLTHYNFVFKPDETAAAKSQEVFNAQKPITADQVHNSDRMFKQLYKKYKKGLITHENHLLENLTTDLSNINFDVNAETTAGAIAAWMFPLHPTKNMPALMLPQERLPLPHMYMLAEQQCLGTISHEYDVEGDFFHVFSYFTSKQSGTKIMILHLIKEYARQENYDLHENILHYWYGGRAPKSGDQYYVEQITDRISVNIGVPATISIPFSGYYPPVTPYPAARDTFVSSAHRQADESADYLQEITEEMQDDQHQKRIKFNQEIMNQVLSRSTTNNVFKAAQKLDICFNMLDCLLTLMYHDLIGDTKQALNAHFIAIKYAADEKQVKNYNTLVAYLKKYVQKDNAGYRLGSYLPLHIKLTAYKLTNALNAITQSDCQPQFKAVCNVIDNIERVIQKYRLRTMSVRAIEPSSSNQTELLALVLHEREERDKQIAELMRSNNLLEQSNRKLAEEMRDVKAELTGVKDQLKIVIGLLLKSTPYSLQ